MDTTLYVVTDPPPPGSRDVVETIRAAVAGGATMVQFRDKHADTRTMLAQARALLAICSAAGVPLIINDRVDIALASGAQGVHVGQRDMPASVARRLLGPEAIVGVSVRTIEELREAERDGASYVAANGVWATPTKTDFGVPLGLDGLRALADATDLPLVAIGGINEANAASVAQAGAAGIAVVSAVMYADDPAGACARLRASFEAGRRLRAPTGCAGT